jgi:HTH-type transcriptional regulator, glycine betaine synthesis regulator
MLFQPDSASKPEKEASAPMSELEREAIEMFINFLKLIGLQKSVGEIYGLLFVSPRPLCMEEIMHRLNLSLGTASQGLKLLRGVGAVKAVYSPGDRRDHFAADLELSKFATVFIKEELRPRVERALERIEHMESLIAQLPAAELQGASLRLDRLRHWLEKGEKMLPWLLRFLVK